MIRRIDIAQLLEPCSSVRAWLFSFGRRRSISLYCDDFRIRLVGLRRQKCENPPEGRGILARTIGLRTLPSMECGFTLSAKLPALAFAHPTRNEVKARPQLNCVSAFFHWELLMKFFSLHLDSLRKLYINQVQMLLSAEQQIVAALPGMVEAATDIQLKQAFQSHLQETGEQIVRLQRLLQQATGEAEPVKCKVLAALVDEAEGTVNDASEGSVRDAALIASAQQVEHYEIACYGAVRQFAQILGEDAAAELLDRTLKEEGHADHLLSDIAQRVNPYAEKAA
jgi:ferritin-like metal-binding protein YciE